MSRIMIIGAGVVGAATGNGFTEHDHDVTYVDVNPDVINRLTDQGCTAITPDDVDLNLVDAVFVSVTALTGEDGIDLTHLLAATRSIGRKLRYVNEGHFPVIVFRCTMPPGTVRGTLVPMLEEFSGRKVGVDFGVAYNPEFLRAATAADDFLNPRAIVLASFEERDRAHERIRALLRGFGAPSHWVTFEEAELLKYVNNVGNAVKITFFNFMRMVAEKFGINPEDVFALSVETAEGLWNPVYGTRDHGAFGGVCLPKDTKALRHFADEIGIDVAFLDAVLSINQTVGKVD